ncbi:hypothetical protein FOA52_012684 [Chlamydomonas sp. UWO 241]|nr:hypothetical protein FOA52_012684 [Chlamydomonas sp. UWO 241]
MRSLQQDFDFNAFPNFPFCLCDEDTQFNPIRAGYNGENTCASTKPAFIGFECLDWVIFVDPSVPVPPTPTLCSTANIGKIEWVAGPNAKACVRKTVIMPAVGAEIVKTPDFIPTPSGDFVMKVTNLNYERSEAPVTVSLRLEPGCAFEDVFPMSSVVYSITIAIYQAPGVACPAVGLHKLELNLLSAANVAMWRGAFKDAMIGLRATTAIYFETARPIVKFTNLAIPCGPEQDGALLISNSTLLTFLIRGATLADVCMGDFCQYAAFTTSDNTGACPGGLIATA